jgi:hypothetical protein
MAFPSRVQGAGQSGGATTAICGDVSSNGDGDWFNGNRCASVSAVVTQVGTAGLWHGRETPSG